MHFHYKGGVIIKVLGLDLATKKSGYCFKENKQLIDFGLIRANEKDDIDHRIMQIYLQVKDIVKKYKPDYIVFENTPVIIMPNWVENLVDYMVV